MNGKFFAARLCIMGWSELIGLWVHLFVSVRKSEIFIVHHYYKLEYSKILIIV